MRNRFFSTLVVALFFCVAMHAVPAHAELKVAVVDVNKLLSDSKAAKAVQSQIDEKRKSFMSEVETAEKKLRDEISALEKKRDSMSKEELAQKGRELTESRMAARKQIEDKKSKLDAAYTDTMGKLTQAIYNVCQKIATDRGIDLVITRQNIIVGNMSLDITKDVLTELDKTLPTLSLDVKK